MSLARRRAARRLSEPRADERFWRLQRLVKDYFTLLSATCRQCNRRLSLAAAANWKALQQALEEDASTVNRRVRERVRTDWESLASQAGFDLAKMAVLRGVSPRHLQRLFQRQFQCCPRKWLRELRCQQARRLITRGYSSKAAAAELKFATDAHFCREFKKVFGVPPQHYAPKRLPFPLSQGANPSP